GGLGEIGLALAGYLARTVQARLVLTGRSSLPTRDTWEAYLADPQAEERIQQKIRHLLELEARGAEFLLVQADIADQKQVNELIEQTLSRFGTLHGVFHAAGNLDQTSFKPVQEINPADCEAHFATKVYGTLALFKALEGLSIDFCLLFSSISAVLGGLGFAGYAAGNRFLDSFARWVRHERPTQRWISVNWDTWLTDSIRVAFAGKTMLDYAMTLEEGLECLNRVLANAKQPLIVHSTGDLQKRLQQWTYLSSTAPSPQASERLQNSQRTQAAPVPISGDYERTIAAIWKEALGVKEIGLNDNFFELGGNSLIGIQVIRQINKAFNLQLPNVVLFEAPTVRALALHARPASSLLEQPQVWQDHIEQRRQKAHKTAGQQDIALIGMAGRFPGASNIEQFWQNLRNGVESISFFTEEELAEVGVPEHLLKNPSYVRARPILEDIEGFDAAFFGYTPRDADLLDPQHRLFLESCWEAMEMAGYNARAYKGLVGVFGGSAMSTYLLSHASSILGNIDDYQLVISNDKDSLTTTVSYKLNLKGPSVAVQTFCSTSLVAVHLAAQSLLNGECDMAMAGGVSVRVPSKNGYLYQEGGMESMDGHCRTFDAAASGSLFGDGVGVVVLKRLDDALADGDTIHAVIKGTSINNDGSLKVSYSAPSVVGQTEAIKSALASANVSAESISYVEAHGTATELGDPIEVTALTKAFRSQTDLCQFCAIGSVKTNIGHLDRAAGVSGLIKTVLALRHEELPATLHYQSPNPEIDFVSSPFYVNARLTPWERNGRPRRAMVNSLGMGGTNAHVILEEAPPRTPSDPSRAEHVFVLSARTASALERVTENLRVHLQQHPEVNVADVAYTLQVGRQRLEHRSMLVGSSRAEILSALATGGGQMSARGQHDERPLILLFPAEDTQWERIARTLYASEAEFRTAFDRGSELLLRQTGLDLCHLLALGGLQQSKPSENLVVPSGFPVQAALVLSQYALGHLLLASGLAPQAILGHGPGIYTAASLAGVFTLEEALLLVLEQTHAEQQEGRTERTRQFTPRASQIPLLSPLTGGWLNSEESLDLNCWQKLAEQTTPAFEGLEQLLREPDSILLTVGCGQMIELIALMAECPSGDLTTLPLILTALPSGQSGSRALLATLGQLWLAGGVIDWERFYSQERRYRVPLPTYPFEKQRYWIEAGTQSSGADNARKQPLKDWFYLPGWKQTPPARALVDGDRQDHWVFFLDEGQLGKQLITSLALQSRQVTLVLPGATFQAHGGGVYTIRPEHIADYEAL
ncbi:MAG TPA: SDR family oxidoreductase, partial [Ktedonobacteraceae bacterium]|nr:SDR family oxidoreductase [Ktedonobacteraceae bacterium]